MKKILFCTATLNTGNGGVASYAQDFIRAFKDEFLFSVISGDDGVCEGLGIKVTQVQALDWSYQNVVRLLSIINEEKPDIIINSSFPLLSIASPFIPNEIKLVSISHFTNGMLAKRAGLNGEYLDAMIGLSSYAKDFLEKYSGVTDKDKVKVVYNFMQPKNESCIDKKQNTNVLNIVYPGGSNYQKSADIVCKAILKLLKTDLKFNLYWIGNDQLPGNNWPLVRTKSLHDILPSDNRIKKLGGVPREEAQRVLSDANIFLLPSRGEGFPISLIEAMRGCCIPIISDAKHGALDVINNGKNGFIVKQGDSDDLYQRIVYIIKNHANLGSIYLESYKLFSSYLIEDVWKNNMRVILNEHNNHEDRITLIDNNIIQKGRRKMHSAERHFWFFDRFIKLPGMMIKYRYIRYIYRKII